MRPARMRRACQCSTRSAKVPISSKPGRQRDNRPAIQVATAGVRNCGCTRLKMEGSRPIARHGEPDARLANLKDQNGRNHAQQRAEQHHQTASSAAVALSLAQIEPMQRIDHRRGIIHQQLPVDKPGQHHGHADIQNRADDQRRDECR